MADREASELQSIVAELGLVPSETQASALVRYIDKQNDEVERASGLESLVLPSDLDYGAVTALSFEVRQTLARHRPATLGQAARVSGITPAASSLLLVHLKKRRLAAGIVQGEAG